MPFRKFLNTLNQELQGLAAGAGGGGGYGGGYGGAFGQTPQVPQSNTPCPRQQPYPGYQDWIGLNDPRFSTFNVCPQCYNTLVRPTPYANAFVTKAGAIVVPPNVPVRCDMSRFWVRVAGTVLLTMNQDGRHDITLLARVAGIRAQEGECPNAQLASAQQPLATGQRTWCTVLDPQTGVQPLPGWTICPSCVFNIQTLCPAIANCFAPVQPATPREATCALVPSDRYDDTRTHEILGQVGGCAVTTSMLRRADMSQLINWLRANPPPSRGAPSSGPAGGFPLSSYHQPPPNGLCPRNYPSTTLRCHTIRNLFELTVCEQCYADVIKPSANQGSQLALAFDTPPSTIPSGFTCQLYSDRMRRVWREAIATGNTEFLRQKVSERRAKERELQAKTAQLQQQASQLRLQAQTQEQLAVNAFRVAANSASNNIMLAGVGVAYRVDSHTVAVPSGVVSYVHM